MGSGKCPFRTFKLFLNSAGYDDNIPSSRSSFASSKPMPLLPPVMKIVLFSSFIDGSRPSEKFCKFLRRRHASEALRGRSPASRGWVFDQLGLTPKVMEFVIESHRDAVSSPTWIQGARASTDRRRAKGDADKVLEMFRVPEHGGTTVGGQS